MTTKRILQLGLIVALLTASLVTVSAARAWSGCTGYITVGWGDTLSGLASACGTTVDSIRTANPGLGWWLVAGQVIYMPGSSSGGNPPPSGGGTYVVQLGDTLGGIAFLHGISLSDLLSVNPQIRNASLIYPGQVINLPSSALAPSYNCYPCSTYPPSGYPPTYYPPATSPTPIPVSPWRHLRVTYGHGLLVRTGPGTGYPEIKSQYVSAVKFSAWLYRKDTMKFDTSGLVWVEVQLAPQSGYSTGWIMVRDALGHYFTNPEIGPRIDPFDP